MIDTKNLKCYCCKYYDNFEGYAALSCKDDFKISIEKIKQVSKDYELSIRDTIALIDFEQRSSIRRYD